MDAFVELVLGFTSRIMHKCIFLSFVERFAQLSTNCDADLVSKLA